jgi:hypothetical protein
MLSKVMGDVHEFLSFTCASVPGGIFIYLRCTAVRGTRRSRAMALSNPEFLQPLHLLMRILQGTVRCTFNVHVPVP